MGQTCSSAACASPAEPEIEELSRNDSPDPVMYDLMRQSIRATTPTDASSTTKQNTKRKPPGQHHLLYSKHASKGETPISLDVHNNFPKPSTGTSPSRTTDNDSNNNNISNKPSPSNNKENTDPLFPSWLPPGKIVDCPTRLLVRRRSMRVMEEGGGTHIYAIRYPEDTPDRLIAEQAAPRPESARPVEQCPRNHKANASSGSSNTVGASKTVAGGTPSTKSKNDKQKTTTTKTASSSSASKSSSGGATETVDYFTPKALANAPKTSVSDWVTVSEEHDVYIADVGLTDTQCDYIVSITEQVCKGQYAAYTYAKQTLGCREFPILAQSCVPPVHTVVSEITQRLVRGSMPALQLDDREPHIVKYDVTKKERQKLDMHTDKSEWTFLIALSHGCGVDYEGGGTYFECLDATIHIQRGHCLVFPGKLRHCGQKITSGLRFLLVGFLVDKSNRINAKETTTASNTQRSLVPHYPLFVVPPEDDQEQPTNMPDLSRSPFFRPREKPDVTSTPGGTLHRRQKPKEEEETKSTVLGCSANLINAIVGSGIVGLPYAIKEAGFVAGICLVILCALLTEKSLRLLIETAKHVHVPSYETVAEAAFGRFGFLFVAANMFIMAYGAMLSYLMVVKDTFSFVFGIDPENDPMRRALLFVISITFMVPLSCQRDMADLSKTSRINVCVDFLMVMLVLYLAPIRANWATFEWQQSIVNVDTIFVGLGVLSFAFVCQHSAFIIAGSLDNPTKGRWSNVTRTALIFCGILAMSCGVGGFVGFQEKTEGNILNSLDKDSVLANVARGLLGSTMLFVYPMESFVARHVCVVLFFKGRSAHEGDDTSVLNRRDRRITLTIILYLMAVIPAAMFKNLGTVLAASGAVGGSCLAYIGPGAVYLGVHGARFLELAHSFFGDDIQPERATDEETAPLYNANVSGDLPELEDENGCLHALKRMLWYLLLMPVWTKVASFGKSTLTEHVTELALKSPHPIRIGNVRFASAREVGGAQRVVVLHSKRASAENQHLKSPINTMLIHADSLQHQFGTARTTTGQIVALPKSPHRSAGLPAASGATANYQAVNPTVVTMTKRQRQEESLALEDDPQQVPPSMFDFFLAILYIIFGIVAMVAGIVSIFLESQG
eukprot:Nitzschia sp. Nitz4//scaffold34_size148208//46360//50283//NITZ4_002973-RA/size148208-processed-gene-0.38-mRNA-1//-1//CDS//3329548774//4276//frame0